VRRLELAIEERKSAGAQPGHEVRKRNLRSVGLAADHRFAEKRPAERDPVKAADQLSVAPRLDRMGTPLFVEDGDRTFDLVIDPGIGAILGRFGTKTDDVMESAVGRGFEAIRKQSLFQAARKMEAIERQDRARFGLDPIDRLRIAAVRHRKHADGVGAEQEIRIERRDVAGHGC
jgi:hypothetical protein